MGLTTINVANLSNNLVRVQGTEQERITVTSGAAVNLAGSLSAGALDDICTHVWIQTQDQTIRITADGGATTPAAAVGFSYVDGTSAIIRKELFEDMRAIGESSTGYVEVLQLTK